jgi:hypothetical protein
MLVTVVKVVRVVTVVTLVLLVLLVVEGLVVVERMVLEGCVVVVSVVVEELDVSVVSVLRVDEVVWDELLDEDSVLEVVEHSSPGSKQEDRVLENVLLHVVLSQLGLCSLSSQEDSLCNGPTELTAVE